MADGDGASTAELIDLVVADPRCAGVVALARLRAGAYEDDLELAHLHWVAGRAARESGQHDRARHHLEEAAGIAAGRGDLGLLVGIHSSMVFTLAYQGDLDTAEKILDIADDLATPGERARLLAQRGLVTYLRGDLPRGAHLLTVACDELRGYGDLVHEARHRVNLGVVMSDLGRYAGARRQLARAVVVAEGLGLDAVVGGARSALGYVLTLQGDLPGAMREFAAAERCHVAAAATSQLPKLYADHAKALAEAALFDDATALLDRAVRLLRGSGQLADLPDCLVRAAEVRLARGDLAAAEQAADEAVTLFAHQGRRGWQVRAAGLALLIRARREGRSAAVVEDLRRSADQLEGYGWIGQAVRFRLIAIRLEVEAGRPPRADARLRRAVRFGPHANRILLAYVDAVAALNDDDRAAARRVITRGLRVATAGQAGLGALEARALAARHGYDLSELGARMALEDRRPRELLARIEATRVMSSRMPLVRPPDDEAMAAMLTELRALTRRIGDASVPATRRVEHERQRSALERRMIRHARGVSGDPAVKPASWEDELADALAALGPRRLLAYALVDQRLVVVSVRGGRARIHDLGSPGEVGRRLDAIAFALHRLNRAQGSAASRRAAEELLDATAAELAAQLLPPGVASGNEPVVVVPTARLHDVPWGLLPGLAGRSVSVNPSISAWAKAEQRRLDRGRGRIGEPTVGLIAGPGLQHADAEIAAVRRFYRAPVVLDRDRSTVAGCLELVAGCDVVHFACHGSFRTDNPMFSSLGLADGPLVVYDFERLPRFPATVVLSACSTASARVLHGGSLLGLAAALIALGVANVVAPLVPVSDLSSAGVMTDLHRALSAGVPPAAALGEVYSAPGVGRATTGAFVALGA